jgi:hypothetical protein
MQDEKNTIQQLGRTENMVENLKNVRAEDLDFAAIEQIVACSSPVPWAFDGDRIISVPLQSEWDAVEEEFGGELMPEDDPRWETLPDPTVAFVTPSVDDEGQGSRDGKMIAMACSAIPVLLRRVRALERERDQATAHLRTMRKELASSRSAMGFLAAGRKS